MPSRKENREFAKQCATIGSAALALRQGTWGPDVEHPELLRAAIDSAAVQLLLLTNGDPLMVPGEDPISTGLRIDNEGAREGIRILGWQRLEGIQASPTVLFGLIQPSDWADLVVPDAELFQTFIEMTRLWWAAREVQLATKEGERSGDTSIQQLHALVWRELQRRVYRRPGGELSIIAELSISTKLTILSSMTQAHWIARVNQEPMPKTSNGPLWYFEEFSAYSQLMPPR
jgi:hypothetical protein